MTVATEVKHLSESDFPNLDCSTESGYCTSYGDLKFINPHRAQEGKPPLTKTYYHWEDNVAVPHFESLGYKICSDWFDGEADSFGPLFRKIRLSKDGEKFTFICG